VKICSSAVLAMGLMLFGVGMSAQDKGKCPMVIGIDAKGHIFTNRFDGWYRVSFSTLERDLRGGCYNDSNPTAASSVTLQLVKGAPQPRIRAVYDLLARAGWPRQCVAVESAQGPGPH
jgi:hypothetical protein